MVSPWMRRRKKDIINCCLRRDPSQEYRKGEDPSLATVQFKKSTVIVDWRWRRHLATAAGVAGCGCYQVAALDGAREASSCLPTDRQVTLEVRREREWYAKSANLRTVEENPRSLSLVGICEILKLRLRVARRVNNQVHDLCGR